MPPTPPPVFSDPWTESQLQDFVARAIEADFGDPTRRDLLLMHLPRSARDRLPIIPEKTRNRAHVQLVSDLRRLAAREDDAFERWRDNAADVAPIRFAKVIRTIQTRPNPVAPPRPPKEEKRRSGLFLIAFIFLVSAIVSVTLMMQGRQPDAQAPASAPSTGDAHDLEVDVDVARSGQEDGGPGR